jgi:hypothetical protein
MRKSVLSGVVAGAIASGVIGGVAAPVHAQNAVQWRVEDGGNGHWYRVAGPEPNMTWPRALSLATQSGGHPVTFGSAAEIQFAVSIVTNSSATLCPLGPWIGLFQDRKDASYSEPAGGWKWIDGTTAPIAWDSVSPNNTCFGVAEDFANMQFDGRVNDLGEDPACVGYWPNGAINSVVIEWSADCNSDGVVDFGQIRAGELDDANANNIPDCCEQGVACLCPSDIDGNGVVDAIDLAIVIGYWGTNGGKEYPQADIDRSGEIDAADLATLLGAWGPCE